MSVRRVSDRELKAIEVLRQNPVLAAHKLLRRNNRPMELTWYQRRILKDLWSGKPQTLLIMGRGTGKTFTLAVFLVLKALLYPRDKCGIVGPTYRQAKFVFDEIVNIWEESDFVRASTKKDPFKTPEQCEIQFTNGSRIIALPLGDGNKIRGARFWRLVADEAAQIPEEIIDTVLLPFLNTSKDPMSGKTGERNQLIMASTAYYQFNHLYKKFIDYQRFIAEGNHNYSVHRYTYLDAPPGFVDLENIEHQRRTVPKIKFDMENLCIFPADSDGFFPASLINTIEDHSLTIEPKGVEGAEYVMGIDPARQSDNFAICIARLTSNGYKVVRVETMLRQTFPKMMWRIRELLNEYNVVRIAMDAGGGGTTIKDLLAESVVINPNTGSTETVEPIIDMNDPNTKHKRGLRILDMVNFTPKEINAMNFDLKADMENKRVAIPGVPKENLPGFSLAEQEEMYEEIRLMREEIESIVATPLQRGGLLHFDTPNKSLRKDRYTALLLAGKAARDCIRGTDENIVVRTLPAGRWVYNSWLSGRRGF